jgi:dGTPase
VQYSDEPHRPPWQYDHDRITFSSAFRRLQDKTQVFPLSSNDYVRTRLTHSLETAAVAKSLGNLIGFSLQDRGVRIERHPLEFGMITSAAALAHDIGNPPFGHSGEDAIRHWFLSSECGQALAGQLKPQERSDFTTFEGNAEGFRILAKLQMYREKGGMQLTAATMAASVKYPIGSDAGNRKYTGTSTKKFGYFQSERPYFEKLTEYTGLVSRHTETGCYARHPLALVVEAADDICYRIVDLEDAFQQRLIAYSTFEDLLAGVINNRKHIDRARSESTERSRVTVLRSIAIGESMSAAADVFEERHDALLTGDWDGSLISESHVAKAFGEIKDFQKVNVYTNDRVLRVEAAGFRVIGGLLDAFAGAVFDLDNTQKQPPSLLQSQKVVALLPGDYLKEGTVYERLLGVTDYICGMTDSYAVNLFRNISGISIP